MCSQHLRSSRSSSASSAGAAGAAAASAQWPAAAPMKPPVTNPRLWMSEPQRRVFGVVLFIAHVLVLVCVRLSLRASACWRSVRRPFSTFSSFLRPSSAMLGHPGSQSDPQSALRPSSSVVGRLCGTLNKTPRHIAFVVVERNRLEKYEQLAKFVVWSVVSGIDCISLYDQDGALKAHQCELLSSIVSFQRSLALFPRGVVLHWHGHSGRDEDDDARTPPPRTTTRRRATNSSGVGVIDCNGGSGGGGGLRAPAAAAATNGSAARVAPQVRHINIGLLSLSDGKPDLARAARRLAARVLAGEIETAAIDEAAVGGELATNRGLPDPDLLVRLGWVQSNVGFLPWQTRLTEIHNLCSVEPDFDDFFAVLKNYSKCEQRFGV